MNARLTTPSTTPWPAFMASVPGKWVFAGEHAVLRGGTAVALPHPKYSLTLDFEPTPTIEGERLTIEPKNSDKDIRTLLKSLSVSPNGKLTITSTIPIGAGLGSSAALCVAITKWLAKPLKLETDQQLFEAARKLEHHFHGRSSGMDIAAILANGPISFDIEKGAKSLGIKHLPYFSFHDTGTRAKTSECVAQVESLRNKNISLALKTDKAMAEAAREGIDGLMRFSNGETDMAPQIIAKAMKQAQECFYSWQLVPESAVTLEKKLLSQGALGVKLTGAGGGGFMVALWRAKT